MSILIRIAELKKERRETSEEITRSYESPENVSLGSNTLLQRQRECYMRHLGHLDREIEFLEWKRVFEEGSNRGETRPKLEFPKPVKGYSCF